ncbi:[FeFe] hydrogenase H-cluster radical SAM maturase HydE [Romboutsia lituseburensis]|uniref:Biotin synthase n=1 Tax=Romboutsia lituseburensis DSM 797 TaxID=1121325 RepID=A0A1G9KM29_9FIRM|nr:[FeFe] hydrogenase H-cluster radical SAM maturase HydE [Romboutsia lituseburensis]CEH34960.1 Biotin synthase [Romboutsia lituseburensis]SDL50587.1 biotin synthase [Romboutsia lituseburensis DSM 797]
MTKYNIKNLIDKLYKENFLKYDELLYLFENIDNDLDYKLKENNISNRNYLYKLACHTRDKYYDKKIFLRGLIEISNFCKNDCYYCGIRCSNKNIDRYRLTKSEILECCDIGYKIGYKTFVLQGGEDLYFDDKKMCDIISSIKSKYPDCAITLSLGEKSYETYNKYFLCGADRYLLRHETSSSDHYNKLHPSNLKLSNRKKCLNDLKKIGFQIGAGFMVDSPFQSNPDLMNDLLYLKKLNPHMVGIGPFIPHKDTIFKNCKPGNLEKTLLLLALARLLLPSVLLPATTALASIDSNGRNLGLLAGCNVIMPNLSPYEFRSKYSLYDNKLSTGLEAFEYNKKLEENISNLNLKIEYSRGDNINWRRVKCL